MRLVCFALVSLLSLSAQQSPDAASLLAESASALGKYLSYQYTVDTSMEMTVAGNPVSFTSISEVRAVNPGKYRIESKAAMTGDSMIVSDGVHTWTYLSELKRYTKKATGTAGMRSQMEELGLFTVPIDPRLALSAHVIRSENLEVDGQSRDCWVVESRIGKLTPPAPPGMEILDAVFTVWIDKGLGIDLQTAMSGKMQGGPMPTAVAMREKTARRSLKFNESLPDSLFTFTPPPEATETTELGSAEGAATGPNAASHATLPAIPGSEKVSAASSAAPVGEPQAFVPNLNPLVRVDPVYPTAARSQDLQGIVHLLVTLDPGGRVTKVEALSGREVLRPAAIDAVRQWSFRPVIRDGHPVFAYTDVRVEFFRDSSRPRATLRDLGIDITEEAAATRRIAELQSRMPRTPEQVLADAEQQQSLLGGMERFYALPKLAKDAVNAGALDRATSYANELLQMAEQNLRDWNYGNAIHDGNMVLGLVALRQGIVEQAKQYLLRAGKTPGSPQLNSFGPNQKLAKELLEKGERDVVVEYFSLCRQFWKMGGGQLDAWTAAVREGRTPDFGANLMY